MSRKDLSRTVIEGGRYYHNCYFRRASHAVERATTRAWLDRVAVDLDEADETAPPPRPRVHKLFRDKLGPAKRWLASQVGRPWDKVYADLCAQFDTRTVAGRHVVHDHMLHWVRRYDDIVPYRARFELVIDAHGILRAPSWLGRSWRQLRRDADAFARGRFAASTHAGWWWWRRAPVGKRCTATAWWKCPEKAHYDLAGTTYHAFRLVADAPLTRGQLHFLERLPSDLRRWIVIPSPC